MEGRKEGSEEKEFVIEYEYSVTEGWGTHNEQVISVCNFHVERDRKLG